MKQKRFTRLLCMFVVPFILCSIAPAYAQFGDILNKGKKAVSQKEAPDKEVTAEQTSGAKQKKRQFMAFTDYPVTGEDLKYFGTEFEAGDAIYGQAHIKQTVKKQLSLKDDDEIAIIARFNIEKLGFLDKGRTLNAKHFLANTYAIPFKIIPDPNAPDNKNILDISILEDIVNMSKGAVKECETINISISLVAKQGGGDDTVLGMMTDITLKFTKEGIAKYKLWLAKSGGGEAKKNFMPKAAMKKASLESAMAKAFATRTGGKKALRVVITENEWTIVNHELTGKILRRGIKVAVAAKEEGVCKVNHYYMYQEYVGGKYAGNISQVEGPLSGAEHHYPIDCGNVNKN